MYLMEHVFERSVIVVGVRSRGFVGEERQRVQELHVRLDCGLVEVMGLGLITCGEKVVRGLHTLIAGVVQVYHRLHVLEENVRKVEKEVERESQSEETAHVEMTMDEVKDTKLAPWATRDVCADEDKITWEMRTTFSGPGQWSAHRAVPRKHDCRHWCQCSGVPRKHTCFHWCSRCALTPTRI